ncbi:MAG: alpha/beta hydrolase family protein [Actinomycetota bacterium]
MWRSPHRLAVVGRAVVATFASLTLAACAACGVPVPAGAADDPGQLALVSTQRLDARLVELVFRTGDLASDTHVRILYPDGYEAQPTRRYPVLYLLHGCCDDYTSWTRSGEAKALTANRPLIVVMPDAGQSGFYSDWYNFSAFGPPRWEDYHVNQLIPWVDAHLRTIAERRGRALAGLSMGGFGAMSYAARHPDLFIAAASFSGAVDTNDAASGQVMGGLNMLDAAPPDSVWGPRATEEVRWRDYNPWDLAGNLAGLQLTLRTGNGMPGGPYDQTGQVDPVTTGLEAGVYQQNVSFHQRLVSIGLPHVWDDYGPGTHTWPYWVRDLKQTLPDLMKAFANPPKPPVPFTYTTAEPAYSVYGWSVSMHRTAMEFSHLRAVQPSGFELAGSGSADVVTAPWYRPNELYQVTIGSDNATSVLLRSDGSGRLSMKVPLGPANAAQQYTPQATLTTQVYTNAVRIEGPGVDNRPAIAPPGAPPAPAAAGLKLPATGTAAGVILVGLLPLAAGLLLRAALVGSGRRREPLVGLPEKTLVG